jgi:hypothetical protein
MKIKEVKLARQLTRMGKIGNAHRIFMKTTMRQRRRWDDNIKKDLKDIGFENEWLVELAQDHV